MSKLSLLILVTDGSEVEDLFICLTADCERDQTSENLEQLSSDSALPPLSHLDVEVIESLPPELFSELNAMYGGKLVDFMAGRRVKNEHSTSSLCAISSSGAEGKLFYMWLSKC